MLSKDCEYFPKCGGCDYLDLEEKDYRQKKQEILGALEADWIWIDPHSRRKINLQIDGKNRLGFFTKKSNDLIEVENCFAAEKEISNLIFPLKNFLKKQEQNLFTSCSITLFDNGLDVIFASKKEPDFQQNQKLISFAKEFNLNVSYRIKDEISAVFLNRKNQIFYPNFKLNLGSGNFIQATKSGLDAIIKIIRENIGNGLNIADIYAGFGAYSFAICDLAKSISAFEGDKKMVEAINKNASENDLSHKIKGEICDLFSNPLSKRELKKFDLIIINPPRNGASPQILEITKSEIKTVIYVSCNPQSFKRDCEILTGNGFVNNKLYALDQFFGSKHLELIGVFKK